MPKIISVKYGEISVDGKDYYSDLVVPWEGKPSLLMKTHTLDVVLLKRLLKKQPEAFVVGIGLEGTVKILAEFRKLLEKQKVKLYVDRTENAIDIFNALQQQGKRVIGILHVTL
ncbi:MAG: hypothetical protein ISS93_02725 [Candidatus Aenigmarchaeota archaeon]|nr:hypothetical protein [Candidatus Aenigmarchaeota archaeon]